MLDLDKLKRLMLEHHGDYDPTVFETKLKRVLVIIRGAYNDFQRKEKLEIIYERYPMDPRAKNAGAKVCYASPDLISFWVYEPFLNSFRYGANDLEMRYYSTEFFTRFFMLPRPPWAIKVPEIIRPSVL